MPSFTVMHFFDYTKFSRCTYSFKYHVLQYFLHVSGQFRRASYRVERCIDDLKHIVRHLAQNVCMYVYMYACMHVCMCVCTYIRLSAASCAD